MTKAAIAREFVDKFKGPQASIARKMYKDHPEAFKDIEDARYNIGYALGKRGKKNRGKAERTSPEHVETGARTFTPYALPESQAEDRKPFKLPVACNNVLVLSDLHIPYQDNAAISAALDYGKAEKINSIFINGDLLDFYQLSRFLRDPRKRNMGFEISACKAFFDVLRSTFPNASIYWLLGNHDIRYQHYMIQKAPELLGIPDFELDAILELNKYKVKMIPDNVLCKIGKLSITHGHLAIRGVFSPVNAARGLFLRAKQSCIIGHCHSSSEHTESNFDGDITTCWSTGALCTLHPDYDPLNTKHNTGFAHITTQKNGDYHVKNIRIYNGKIL